MWVGRLSELSRKLDQAARAVETLLEALREPRTPIVRDAAIQRFEHSFETTWEAARRTLGEKEGLDHASAAAVVRACHGLGLLDEPDYRLARRMIQDRSLTVHTYREPLAAEIFGRLPDYASLLVRWLGALRKRAAQG